MYDNLALDISIDFGVTEQQATENKLEKSRQYLEKLDIHDVSLVKPPTFKIIKNFLNDFVLPQSGQQLRIRTQQQINMIAILLKIAEVHGVMDDVCIATYTLNKEAFSILESLLIAGRIKALSLFVAESYTFRDKLYYRHLKDRASLLKKKYDIHLMFARSHLKITLVRAGNDYYQIEGSMNYSLNNIAEQLLFENNKETYEYDHKFLHKILADKENPALEFVC